MVHKNQTPIILLISNRMKRFDYLCIYTMHSIYRLKLWQTVPWTKIKFLIAIWRLFISMYQTSSIKLSLKFENFYFVVCWHNWVMQRVIQLYNSNSHSVSVPFLFRYPYDSCICCSTCFYKILYWCY
jgi:hypothetical protein